MRRATPSAQGPSTTLLPRDAEVVVIVSNGSDLCEPIRLAWAELGLRVGIRNPHRHPSMGLRGIPPAFYKRIRVGALGTSQFPTELRDARGTIRKPVVGARIAERDCALLPPGVRRRGRPCVARTPCRKFRVRRTSGDLPWQFVRCAGAGAARPPGAVSAIGRLKKCLEMHLQETSKSEEKSRAKEGAPKHLSDALGPGAEARGGRGDCPRAL